MCRLGLLALTLALLLCGCGPAVDHPTPGNLGGPVPCGRIDAVDLISLPEREAAEYARRGGCEMRVVTRDGRTVGPTAYYQDPDLPVTVVHVRVRDGYVNWLGR